MSRRDILKNILLLLAWVLVLALVLGLALVALLCFILNSQGEITETTDPADYGVIRGNYDNDYPAEFMFSFFPEEISEDFSNVHYCYKAQKADTYACEIWLEFDIADGEKFAEFIAASVDPEQVTAFSYDPTFSDYTISEKFMLTCPENNDPGDIHIEDARIGKILYDEETQHVICFALLVCDGGYASNREFGSFFTRFRIDPIEYAAAHAA